jgi:hypothetical protein
MIAAVFQIVPAERAPRRDRATGDARSPSMRWVAVTRSSAVRPGPADALDELGDARSHPGGVRALPVDAPARRAPAEDVVARPDGGREGIRDPLLRDRLQEVVAAEAAPERSDGAEEVEAIDHLGQLAPRLGRADPAAVADHPPLQEPHVAGQEEAVLVPRDPGELLVGRIVPPPGEPSVGHAPIG